MFTQTPKVTRFDPHYASIAYEYVKDVDGFVPVWTSTSQVLYLMQYNYDQNGAGRMFNVNEVVNVDEVKELCIGHTNRRRDTYSLAHNMPLGEVKILQ